MKTTTCHVSLALLLGLSAAGAPFAAEKPAASDARVTVVFAHPEKYADVRDYDFDRDNASGGERYFPLIREHLETVAGRVLAPGHKLTVTFSDIDLAGEFEPWRGPQLNDVRIVKDIYPPRLTFTFQVTDENGRVLNEGERKLVDLAYQMRIGSGFRDDPLRYEKDMLSDWVRVDLKPRKA